MNNDLLGMLGLYWGELMRRRRRALIIAWLVLFLALPLTYSIPDRYRSNALINIDTDALMAHMMNSSAIIAEATNQAENVRLLMFAQSNLEKAMMNADLDLSLQNPYQRNTFLQNMSNNLKIQLVGRDSYGVSYIHEDPKTAQKIVEQVINIFIDINLKKLNTDADHNLNLTTQQVRDLEAQFDAAQKELIEFREKNGFKLQVASSLSNELRDLDLSEERYPADLRNVDSRIRQATLVMQSTPKVLTSTDGSDPCNTLELKGKMAEMRSRGLTDSHPDIQNLKTLIASLQQSCKIENTSSTNPAYVQLSDQLATLKLERETLLHNIATIKSQRLKLNQQLTEQPALVEKTRNLEVRMGNLSLQLQQARDTAAQMQRTLDSNKKITLVKYQIAQPATYPLLPEFPNRPILLIVATLASLIAGMVAVIIEIQLKGRMPTMIALRNAFDVPILGGISDHSRRLPLWADMLFWGGLMAFFAMPLVLIVLHTLG